MPVVLACSPSVVVPVTVTGAAVVSAVGVKVPAQVVLALESSVFASQLIAPLGVVPLRSDTVSRPVLVTGTETVAGWSAMTGAALSGDPALAPLTVGVPMVRSQEHPVSADVDVTGLVVLSPVPLADVFGSAVGNVEAAAVTGLDEPDCAELTGARACVTDEAGRRVADPVPVEAVALVEPRLDEAVAPVERWPAEAVGLVDPVPVEAVALVELRLVEAVERWPAEAVALVEPRPAEAVEVVDPVPVVVVEVVCADADGEVVLVAAAWFGCTIPDTSDVTGASGLVPAVVSVAWLLVGPVASSAWATPTPRSIKPPASNPVWRDRFTQVCMRNLSKV
ncbi:hypothetical protein [Amycolatopsis sp. WGS_07]|uniref:hypothetical protein n=1 Tax=Amycolatopsis sp. WGS_07 TaxID=3076764 RepID=UPI0038737539